MAQQILTSGAAFERKTESTLVPAFSACKNFLGGSGVCFYFSAWKIFTAPVQCFANRDSQIMVTRPMQEKELIRECLNGNRNAQHLLYTRYAEVMLGTCYRYTKSLADAEDVLQEGFIKVFTKLHQFKSSGELGAWIRRIMVNTAITYINKHNRYKREMHIDDVAVHPVSDDNPEIQVDTKELVELIRELPVSYQTVFNLVGIEGFSHVEVSKMLNINENTLRSQYNRARTMLINRLKKISNASENHSYAGRI